MIASFFSTLFDEHEATCFASDVRGNRIYPVSLYHSPRNIFFSINPMKEFLDSNADQSNLSRIRATRCDANVTKFRSFLFEMDHINLNDQLPIIHDTLNDCLTSIVFSGNKSYHTIISLEHALSSREDYLRLWRRIEKLFGGVVDPLTKDPSRLSRVPGAFRKDKNMYQDLIELRSRVPNQLLYDLLAEKGIPDEPVKVLSKRSKKIIRQENHNEPLDKTRESKVSVLGLSPQSRLFLEEGAPEGKWNNSLFKAAVNAAESRMTIDTFIQHASEITGYLDERDMKTIESAYNRHCSE